MASAPSSPPYPRSGMAGATRVATREALTRMRFGAKSILALCLIAPRALGVARSRAPRPRASLTSEARMVAEAGLDEAFTAVTHLVSSRRQARVLDRSRSDVLQAAELLRHVNPGTFHQRPPTPETWHLERQRLGPVRYLELSFESSYQPVHVIPGLERWLAREPNRKVPVRLLMHEDAPRPWVVCVHGARQGQPTDLLVFRARQHHRSGFNVALPVLPVHDARALRTSATFPTLDLLDNLHAITQAVSDLRQTLAWIRQQEASAIAVHGLSLGGHLAAMLVGLEDTIDVAIAGVPMSSVLGVLRSHVIRPLTGDRDTASYLGSEPARALDRLTSPLELAPLVPRDRLFVYGGYADQLSTFAQAESLWHHWGKPAYCWYPGGHVGAVMSGRVQGFVENALGWLSPGRPLRAGPVKGRADTLATQHGGHR